jgi:hypothetical protein
MHVRKSKSASPKSCNPKLSNPKSGSPDQDIQAGKCKEVLMPAVAEAMSATTVSSDPRGCALPTCPVCADSMVAAEASAYVSDNVISYLWTCDTCGYGFVTKHALRRVSRN